MSNGIMSDGDIYDPAKPFNQQIRELIKATHPKSGPVIVTPEGKRFKIEKEATHWNDSYYELTSTDGIGTKGFLHWQMGTLQNGVQDAFAMVVDDLAESGYCPYTLQNHIMMQEEAPDKIYPIIGRLRDLCLENKWSGHDSNYYPIIISGGETAILNTISGFEMGITATGFVKKGSEIIPKVEEGSVIIGIGSSGIHSNGISFYRKELLEKQGCKLDYVLPWGATIGEELTRPTQIYLPAIKAVIKHMEERKVKPNEAIHGMVHITGGGLSKLRELLPTGNALDINVNCPTLKLSSHSDIFRYAFDELNVPSEKMYERFNNGVGYAIATDPQFVPDVLNVLSQNSLRAEQIGFVEKGNGKVKIESQYEKRIVEFSS